MKSHQRRFQECIAVLALGCLSIWPLSVIVIHAGLPWALFGAAVFILWGGVMGWTLATDEE